jgi:hypothetical protein
MSAPLLDGYFQSYDRVTREKEAEKRRRGTRRTALENCLSFTAKSECNGFQRIRRCRQALEALDRRGWQRSFHQRMFHDNFIRACARIFWKREKHGVFAKDHQKILEVHGWDHLSQEVLVSTPRRFGKTISVSMFAAAMLYSCPNLEMSIYSTCKARLFFIQQPFFPSARATNAGVRSGSPRSSCATSSGSWSSSTSSSTART